MACPLSLDAGSSKKMFTYTMAQVDTGRCSTSCLCAVRLPGPCPVLSGVLRGWKCSGHHLYTQALRTRQLTLMGTLNGVVWHEWEVGRPAPIPSGSGHSRSGCFCFVSVCWGRGRPRIRIYGAHAHRDLLHCIPVRTQHNLLPLARAGSSWEACWPVWAPAKENSKVLTGC